ncbi:sulfotransferase family cytosolic 1B member 1-like [Octopus vulgaris]|uniref:Sulfotransferase family cytosolic 1B member 1-like n=2 Tax=Octopus TaxID=6643 RepID=A0AA36F7C8_OCTVU|nr:sulfotransferase 6B1 [Octopus sinensis]XP_029640092.1 sulfotransferase 6B1 [Octopus sinensis]CAI9727024.1 sulfotransferase family cytosolic 1B member 1-like [Octopus vulgaris]
MPEVFYKDPAGYELLSYDYNGFLVPPFPNVHENLEKLPDMAIRNDDVFLLGYMKAGCHWMWEISGMLLKGSAEYSLQDKTAAMLERAPQASLDQLPSPRVLNSHLHLHHLPREIFTKKPKMVFMTRNPRDIAVSSYHHLFQMAELYHYDGDWNGYFHLITEGKVNYGNWFQYMLQWEKDIKDHPELPILILRYEDVKKDPIGIIAKLAEFLELPRNDQLFQDIADKCSFSKMKAAKPAYTSQFRSPSASLFRKGVVGDWKNWFTVSQHEIFQTECENFKKQSTLFNIMDDASF